MDAISKMFSLNKSQFFRPGLSGKKSDGVESMNKFEVFGIKTKSGQKLPRSRLRQEFSRNSCLTLQDAHLMVVMISCTRNKVFQLLDMLGLLSL